MNAARGAKEAWRSWKMAQDTAIERDGYGVEGITYPVLGGGFVQVGFEAGYTAAASEDMAQTTELLQAIQDAALRHAGPYGSCFCRNGHDIPHLGHEARCQRLHRAVQAMSATEPRR